METKSDVTEPVSVMKREGEGKELTSESLDITVNQFSPEKMNKAEPWDQPTEAIKFLEKSENMPVATNIEVENVNDVIKGNVGTIEGEIFLGSLSVAKVACEETSRLADDYQAAEILNQAEKLVPENETLREEKLEDQHVEIVANEEASPEENHQNTKEELRGAEKGEKGVMISDEKTETESDKQTLEMLEATPGQNAGAMVQTPDLIEDLNMDTGKLTGDCDREESTDNGAKTTSIEECLREASFQGREDKEPETSFNLVGKEMGAEAIQLSKNTEDKKNEGHETPHNSTKDVCIPETEGPDDEEEGIENSRGAKDKPDSPLVTALIDERSLKNAGLDVGGNLEENPSITFEERSQETVETIEKKQLTSTEEDVCEKSNLETSVVNKMEDVCFQKVDKPETFKEASETGSEDIVKEGQNELRNQSGIVENIVTTNSSLGMTGEDDENPEPKADGSFMKLEGSIHREGEELAPTEASTREYRDDEGFTVLVGEDNVEVMEHNKSETSKHEGHPQESLLKSEPGKENLESPLDVAAEEIETTASNEHAETITHVEKQRMIDSLEETRKCKTIHADDINNKEIQEEKTISTVDLDKKTVSAEVEIPKKNANDLNVTHPLVEETAQVGGEEQEKVSTMELEGRVDEADRVPTEEEKHVNEAYGPSKSSECSILEHTSTEEAPEAELTTEASGMEVDNLEKVCKLNSEEKLQVTDAGDNIKEEIQQEEEASDTELRTIIAKSDANKKSAIEEVAVKDSDTIRTGEEADQLNYQEGENKNNNSEEATSELNGGDQSCRTDNEMENIHDRTINEEVYEGPKIAEMEDGTEKQIKHEEHTITDHSTESTGEEKTKHSQEDEAEAEKSKAKLEKGHETTSADEGVGIEKQVILEENRIQDQPMVSIEEETSAESSKEDETMVLDTTNRGEDFPEHIVKDADTANDHSTESFEEKTVPESSQEDEANEGYETAGGSTNTERQNIEESVIVDNPTLTVGEEKVQEEVKELNIECIEQNLEATHLTKETKLEAAKDEAEPNKDCYTQSTMGTSEEETMSNESNQDLVENSSVPEPEVSEKEIKEEILEKTESTEETSLKEAEPEYKMKVDSSDLASDHPTLIVGEQKVEEEVKELNIERIEHNLEAIHHTKETKLEAAKNEADPNKDCSAQSTIGTSEEETMPNENNRDLIENSSVPEPEVSEKEIKEEILEKADSIEETSLKEGKAEYKMEMDSSNRASDHPTLTVEGEVKVLNIECIEQNLEATYPTEETKLETAKDEEEPNKDSYAQSARGTLEEKIMTNKSSRDLIENSSVPEPEVSEKEIKEEILEKVKSTEETSLKEAEAEYKMVDSSDLTSDHPTITVGKEKVEGEVEELNIQCIEQNLEATHPTDEIKLDAAKDEEEPNKDCYAQSATGTSEEETMPNENNRDLTENSSVLDPKASEKEIKEEILEKADPTEETSLKKAEAEYKMQVASSDLTSDHPALTVEGEVKELNIQCTEQNLEAAKDEANPNKDNYAQSATGISEQESNRDLIENSKVPELKVSEKEIKEEIFENVDSTEETSLKEAEAEYKMQVDSSDLTSDHPTLTVGEEKVEGEVEELNIQCIEQNLEATHPTDETKLEAAKDEAEPNKDCYAQSATGTSEEETMPNESNRDLTENSSVLDPKASEKEIKEEILEKADPTEETSLKKAEAEYKMQVASSDLTSDHPALTVEGEVKELNIQCLEQNLEAAKDEANPNKDNYAQSATGISEQESNRDLIENSKVPELKVSEKEIKEEIFENVDSTEETSLKEAEAEYKMQVDSSDLTSDHPTLTVGEEKVEGEVKELNIECIEQNLEATHPKQETKPEAVKDEAEPTKDCYAQSATGTSEEETMPNESNRDLIENSSVPELEVSEKEIKEEILEKAYSTEETSLKEAEVEYKMQVESSDLTLDHPTLTVEGEVKELNIECIEQNPEEIKPEAAKDEAEPKKDCYAQSATGTSEDETMPNESNKDLIPELEVSEKEIKEEILEKVDSTEETSLKEAEVEYKMQVDSSDLTSVHPTLTVEGEVKELNIECIEQNPEATYPTEETRPEAEKDEAEPNKDCYAQSATGTSEEETMLNESKRDLIENSSVPEPEVSGKQTKKEILQTVESTQETGLKEAEAEYKMQVDSSDLTSDHPTLTVGEEKVEGEVKELNIQCIEQNLEATHPTEETKLEASKDEEEPNEDCYAQSTTRTSEEETMSNESNRDLIENSSVPEPEVSQKEIKEETLKKADSTEERSLKEAKGEYKMQVDSADLASEKKGLLTTETSESGSNGADITAKPTKTSELGENKDMENPTARNDETEEAGEKIEHQAQIETHYTMSEGEDQREVATSETPLDDIFEQSLEASSTLSLKEHNLMTTKTSETTDETPKKDESLYAQAETPLVVEVSEEKLMQKEETSTNPRDGADMRSVDIGKESVNEEVQDEDQELYTPPQADNEKSIFESDVELGSEIGRLETLKDEKSLDIGLEMDKSEDVKPVDEAPKCAEGCDTCADTEKDILEQEHSVKNFEGSLKDGVEFEKAENESEAGGHSHGSEASETRSISTAAKENLESVEPGEGLKCAPDSLPEDQSNKTLPQNKKTRIEEESDNVKDQNTESTEEQIIGQDFQEGKKKMHEEMEPKLEAEDQINKTQDANETIKDVILTEEVLEGVERADKTENFKEQIIEGESCTRELHTISIADEKVNEVKDPDLEPNENLETTDSNVDTETLKSKVAEDLNWEAEASSMTKALEEEMKKACQKPVDVTSSVSEVSEENIEVAANCNEKIDSTPTVVTEETSLGEVQQDKSVKAFDISSDTKSPETTKTTDSRPQGEEVASVKLEEAFGVVSQLPEIEENADEKTVNLRKPDADANEVEVEETKPSDVVSDSKCHCIEEIHETGISLTVGMPDTDEIEEEIKEVPETICKPRYLGVEAVTDGEITPDQTLSAEKLVEQLQVALPELDSRKLEETSGMMPQIQTFERENAANVSVIAEKLDADEVEETNTFDSLHESKDHGVEEIHDSETSLAVRKIDSDKLEELHNEVPEAKFEPRYLGGEAVTDGKIPSDQTLPAVKLEEQLQVPSTALLSRQQDHETMASIEKIKDETTNIDETEVDSMKVEETSGIVSQLPTSEWENVDNVTVEKLDANDIEVEETKTSDAVCKSKDWGAEIHETGTSLTMGKTDAEEMEDEIKEVPETMYQSVEVVTDEITPDQTLPVEKLDEQLQVPSIALLSREQDYETMTITEKKADESTKKEETEGDSTKLEEASVMVSQLPTIEQENADDVSVTVANLNADEVEVEETIASDVICESKDQGIEEIHETGTSPAVGKTGKDEIEEEIKEVPETISEPRSQGIDAVTQGEITPDQTFPAAVLEEKLQVPSSALLSREHDQETKTTTEKMGEESTKTDETEVDGMKLEENFGTVSQLPPIEQENADVVSVIVEKLDADEVGDEETKISDAVCESKDHGVEEIDETGISPTAGKIDRDKKEGEIKEVPETIFESRYQGVEAVTDGENTHDRTLSAGILEEQLKEQSSALLSRGPDYETMTITEKIADESTKIDETEVDSTKLEEASVMVSQLPTIERQNADDVTVEKLDPDEVEDTKILDTVCESKDQGVEEIHETGTSPTEGKTCMDEMEEEIKRVTQTISETRYQAVEAVADDEVTRTLPAGILEEKLQVSSSALLSEQNHEIMTTIKKIEDESTNKDDNQVNKNLIDSFAMSATEEKCLQKEELRELEVSKEEHKLIEGIQKDSPNEASKEKSTALEDVSAVEPQEYVPEIKYADSPSECEERPVQCHSPGTSKDETILDSGNSVKEVDDLPIPHSTVKEDFPEEVGEKCEEASNLEFEETGKVLESASDVESPEVLAKPEETKIKEEHLKAAITELRAKKDQDEETTEAYETIKNEISSEEITKEKDVAKDYHLVSPDEETVAKSNLEDELKTEEYPGPGEKINKTIDITKNGIPNEELPRELEKAGEYKNIKETITGDDRAVKDTYQVSVGDGAVTQSLPEEAKEGKKVEKASIEFNIENQGDETTCRDTVTEAMALSEEAVLVKHDEDGRGADGKETVIRMGEEAQNTNLDVPPVTHAAVEEAPDKNADEKIEEVSQLASKEPIQIIETYEENKQIAVEDCNYSVSLVDDENPKHTSPKSAYEVSDVTEGLNMKEQDVNANEPRSLPLSDLTETSQKERADKDSENNVEEKQCDLIKCGGEHRKDEDPLKLSTRGNERKLDEGEIYTMLAANEEKETQIQNEELNVLGSGMGISQKDGIVYIAKGNEITEGIQELEKTTLAKSNEQIPREEDPNGSTEATISTGSDNVPLVQQDKTAKTFQSAEVEDLKAGNASRAETEAKGVEREDEKRMGDECEETTEKSTSIESAKMILSDHLQGYTEVNSQVAKHLTEEGELMISKEELQTEKAETAQVEEAKTDEEEEGDEHKRADSGSDAPVMVEASRDMDVKIAHKKSHNILSGVGSKVKHSIAKVKKAITGKSSHSKSPK